MSGNNYLEEVLRVSLQKFLKNKVTEQAYCEIKNQVMCVLEDLRSKGIITEERLIADVNHREEIQHLKNKRSSIFDTLSSAESHEERIEIENSIAILSYKISSLQGQITSPNEVLVCLKYPNTFEPYKRGLYEW